MVYHFPVFCRIHPEIIKNGEQEMHHGKYLAVTDEDGFISIYDTATRLANGPENVWKAHDNAIFDIAWTYDDELLVCGLFIALQVNN